jgi:inositol-phosphate transport system permease protein
MTPATLLIVLFFLLPVLVTIYISMTDMQTATFGRANFIGLANYVRMLKSPYVPKILGNTLLYVSITLILFNVGLALVLSLLTTHINERVGTAFRVLWLLPRITPSVLYILIWQYATAAPPAGIINQIVAPLGIDPRNWLTTNPWLFVFLANGFVGASFGMIIFTSAIRSIPQDYLMAARVDGASTLQVIWRIIVPMIRWPLMFVMAYQTLSLLTSFEQTLLLTDGGPGNFTTEVWALYAYHTALRSYSGNVDFGYGSALAAVLVVIGIIASVAYLRIFRFREMVAEPKIEVL